MENKISNIMIVDDQPEILTMVSTLLQPEGYHIQTACDGVQALELFKKKPCDVIITDIQMPNMDGITLLQQVKKLDPYVEVIIMTGFATIENVIKILRQNCAFDVYRKQNDDKQKLMLMVKHALEKQSLNQHNQKLLKALTKERTMARAAFDSISDPIIMLNFRMVIIGANKAALKYSKIKNFADCIGQPCYKVLCKTGSCLKKCRIGKHVHTKKTIHFRRPGLKGSDKIENISIYPSIVKKHRLGILVKIQDITHQIEVERQMARADRLASLGQLSGGIAHEIRNPLAGIKLYLDIFADKDRYERSKDEKEIIDEIDTNINKINGIIKRVLTFSNPAESEMNYLDINKLIVDSLDLFSKKLTKSNITKNLYLNKSIPQIKCDYIGLQQVITNLTLNAIQAMGDQGGILCITTSNRNNFSNGKEGISIEVKDTGIGIDLEKQKKIFDPFFTTKPQGTGLGLSISHQIIERHKGKLSFKSIPGKGTSFIIELPVEKEI